VYLGVALTVPCCCLLSNYAKEKERNEQQTSKETANNNNNNSNNNNIGEKSTKNAPHLPFSWHIFIFLLVCCMAHILWKGVIFKVVGVGEAKCLLWQEVE